MSLKKNTTLIVPRLDYNDMFFLFCFVVVVVVVFVALILCAKVLYYMFFVLFWFMCHFVFFLYKSTHFLSNFFLLFCFPKNQTSSDLRCCSWCHSLTFCFLIILTQLKAYYGVYLQLALCNFLIFRTNNKQQQQKKSLNISNTQRKQPVSSILH